MTVDTILVPIDFSETSARVLDFARTLADACGASMHLMHVIAYPLATTGNSRRRTTRRVPAFGWALERRRSREAPRNDLVRNRYPAHEIVKYATDHAIDLIVMGTHWHGPTFQMAAGSIAEASSDRRHAPYWR